MITVSRDNFDRLVTEKFRVYYSRAKVNPVVFGFTFAISNHEDFNFSKCKEEEWEELFTTFRDLSAETKNRIDGGGRNHCHIVGNAKIQKYQLEKLRDKAPRKALYSLGLEGKKMRLIGFFDQNQITFQVALIDAEHKLYEMPSRKVF